MIMKNRKISSKWVGLTICFLIAGYFFWSQWSTARQLEKEQRLIFVGNQFRAAIGRYYENSPGATRQFPLRLEDLVSDVRMAPKAQYIAEVYHDPLGGNEWGLVRNSAGGITGIHSLSEDVPAKVSQFASGNEQFIGKSKYNEWVFQYVPTSVMATPKSPVIASASKHEPAIVSASSTAQANAIPDAKVENAIVVAVSPAPVSRMIKPLAGQIDVAAIQLGAGVPGVPALAGETDRRRRICIVNATRYASSCALDPAISASQEAVRDCVVEAQQRYEQCIGV